MDDEFRPENSDSILRAQQVIAEQAAEIERLRAQLAAEQTTKDLRSALILAATAGTIATPIAHTRLLEMTVETAAHVIAARAASLFLIDDATQELAFEVVLGEKAEEVKKFRVPMGHGIAGLVAASGQPIAISDAQSDPRTAADIAESIGYFPKNMLCVPLFYNEQTIGVLELLDKEGATSFSASDMETLTLFANQAAVAIELSRTHQGIVALLNEVLRVPSGQPTPSDMLSGHPTWNLHGPETQQRARGFAQQLEGDAMYREALELARLVREIVAQGQPEGDVCRTILEGFAQYLRDRTASFELLGATW